MRSKFGCRICGKKSSNSGFVNAGSSENCLCRPCYARQIRSCLQTIGVQTQTEEPTDNFEEGMYFQRFFELVSLVYFEKLFNVIFPHSETTASVSQLQRNESTTPSSYQTISGKHITMNI